MQPSIKRQLWQTVGRVDNVVGFSRLLSDQTNAIVMYHSTGRDPGAGFFGNVSTERLRRDISYLSSKYEIVDLSTVVDTAESTSKQVALTFDDGFRDFYTNAVPILHEFDCPATTFITSGFIDDEHPELIRERHNIDTGSEDTMLTTDQIEKLADDELITIGNHTRTHRSLADVSDRETLEAEVTRPKRELEQQFGISVDHFCYPYGDFNAQSEAVVRSTHDIAVTSQFGFVDADTSRYRLPRVPGHWPWERFRFEISDFGRSLRELASG